MSEKVYVNITATVEQEHEEYLKLLMAENDQNRSQVLRAMIREHMTKQESKKGV